MYRSQFLISINCAVSALFMVAAVSSDLPSVTLPWGTWQANSLNTSTDLVTFQNIRFARPPTGALRFQRPQYPAPIPNPEQSRMNNTYGPTCIQVDTHPSCQAPHPVVEADEDCLFLDVYVPQSVWKRGRNGISKTPVVVWLYGGAFEFGAKSAYGPDLPFYKGNGIISAARNLSEDLIFVAGNYRLGAFGWLSGHSIEGLATANAGLYDQRLLFQWVQDFIHLFGGDRNQVSAWGESAGAGSLLHHLIADGGKQDPLFQRAFLQSPAFQWQWDRSENGTLDQVYRNFTRLAQCQEGDFTCLLKADTKTLTVANQRLYDDSQAVGLFPLGPAVDNDWIKELPAIAYHKGHIWNGLQSLAISHVQYESVTFVPKYIKTPRDFDYFLENFIREPSLANVREAIKEQYPSSEYEGNQQKRVESVIQDSIFVCNTRQMYDAYSSHLGVYMMNYWFGFKAAKHASDLLPTFWDGSFGIRNFLEKYLCVSHADIISDLMGILAPLYQSYLADLAISGDPNKHQKDVLWNKAVVSADGNSLEDVFLVQTFTPFQTNYTDVSNTQDICTFWTDVSLNITRRLDKIEDVKSRQHGSLGKGFTEL